MSTPLITVDKIPFKDSISIFGTGKAADLLIALIELKRKDIKIKCIIDNKNNLFKGIPVINFSEYLENYSNKETIVIASMFFDEIVKDLNVNNIKDYYVLDIDNTRNELKKYSHFKNIGNEIKFIYIEVSSKCNLKCTYCYHTKFEYKSKNVNMDYSLFRRVIDQLKSSPVKPELFLHAFGEPTLNPHLLDMIEYARNSNKFCEIKFVSNLQAVPKEMYDKYFANGLSFLFVSLDALSHDVLNLTRRGSKFDNIVESLHYISSKYSGKIGVITALTRNNKNELIDIYNFLNKLNISNWNIQLGHFHNGQFDLNQSEVSQLKDNLLRIKSEKFHINFEEEKIFQCNQPFSTLVVNALGFITPCCSMTDHERLNFGNINSSEIYKIYGSSEFNEFRMKFIKKESDICKNCPLYGQSH
ncbi:MAG: Fe-S oxidoreductase containing radical SAM protein [uncultured bacterium]|nr:MAG: Fe-S oxidoreductase containing radical SAM protein [uncultured bacterium]